jgi:hypothetical protein
MSYTLEPLSEAHGKAVIDIFNHYVAHSFAASVFSEAQQEGAPLGGLRGCHCQTTGRPAGLLTLPDTQ